MLWTFPSICSESGWDPHETKDPLRPVETPIPTQYMGPRTAGPGVLGEKTGLADPVLLLLPTEAARAEILESIWAAEGANKA